MSLVSSGGAAAARVPASWKPLALGLRRRTRIALALLTWRISVGKVLESVGKLTVQQVPARGSGTHIPRVPILGALGDNILSVSLHAIPKCCASCYNGNESKALTPKQISFIMNVRQLVVFL